MRIGRLWQMWRARGSGDASGRWTSRSRRARGRRAVMFVEFALVGPPFLFCLVFMLELGYDLYAQEILDYGMQNAARQIQIGNAQSVTSSGQFVTNFFCPIVSGLLNCNSVYVNVTEVTDFYSAKTLPSSTGSFTYCQGNPGNLILATAIYQSPSLVAAFVPAMGSVIGGNFVHTTMSASAFVNENYTQTTSPAC
jgi:Flp pilus assembly protein TadG